MLEDLFSENIVDDPDDIERVIEGGDDHNDASGKESDNDEQNKADEKDKDKTKIKRKTGPRPTLNAERLKGPRGLGIMESFFSDVKLHGKGREREDLELVMGRLEHWTHRLFPRMQFDDGLKKIEKLGSKKEVANYVKRIRLGMEEEVDLAQVDQDERADSPPAQVDPFDQLLSPSSAVSSHPVNTDITAEQRERMLRNRLIAEERRTARLKRAQEMKEKYQAERVLDSQTVATPADVLDTNIDGQAADSLQEKSKSIEDMETDEHTTHVDLGNHNLVEIESREEETESPALASTQSRSFENHSEELEKIHDNTPENLAESKDSQDNVRGTNQIEPDIVTEKNKYLIKASIETNENQDNIVLGTSSDQPAIFGKVHENRSSLSNLDVSDVIGPIVESSCNETDNLATVNVNADQSDVTDKQENDNDSSSPRISGNPPDNEVETDEAQQNEIPGANYK